MHFRYTCDAINTAHWDRSDPPIVWVFITLDVPHALELAKGRRREIETAPQIDGGIHYEILEWGTNPEGKFSPEGKQIVSHRDDLCDHELCPVYRDSMKGER